MALYDFKDDKRKAIDASKKYFLRNFLEVMDKTMSDEIEKQIIRSQFLDSFNKFHRFIESQIFGKVKDASEIQHHQRNKQA